MISMCINDRLLVKQMDGIKTLNDRPFSLVMEPFSERQSELVKRGVRPSENGQTPSTDHIRAKPDTFTMSVNLLQERVRVQK